MKKALSLRNKALSSSDPDRIQTCNPQSRNLIFYSVELRGQEVFGPEVKLNLKDEVELRGQFTPINGEFINKERYSYPSEPIRQLADYSVELRGQEIFGPEVKLNLKDEVELRGQIECKYKFPAMGAK